MKVRLKTTKAEGSASRFNICSLNEIIVCWSEDQDSDFIEKYDVFLEATKQWKDMRQAFKDKDLIPNNFNTDFQEPQTPEDRKRGYHD